MILIVEDDLAMPQSLEAAVELAGYDFVSARDGQRALDAAETADPDLVLLDVMLPGIDGFGVVKELRNRGQTMPILLLTARDGVRDRVYGLDAGADDYLPKPFALDELLARVRALLRRSAPPEGTGPIVERVEVDDLVVLPDQRRVMRGERELELTRVEFDTLACLARNAGIVVGRATLLDEIWGHRVEPASNTLEVHINSLRKKTEREGEPRLIHTVRGIGYVLQAQ